MKTQLIKSALFHLLGTLAKSQSANINAMSPAMDTHLCQMAQKAGSVLGELDELHPPALKMELESLSSMVEHVVEGTLDDYYSKADFEESMPTGILNSWRSASRELRELIR